MATGEQHILRQMRVFFSGPKDVDEERNALPHILEQANRDFAHNLRFHLESESWEDMPPGIGPAQPPINKRVRQANLVIVCFWTRWGVPPDNSSRYTSGTEEEFFEALEENRKNNGIRPDVWLFFRDVSPPQLEDPGTQLVRLLAFRNRVETERLARYQRYTDVDHWTKLVHKHLRGWLEENALGQISVPYGAPSKPAAGLAALQAGPRADLAGADLTGVDLAGANLTDANLAGADLNRANLARADLIRANLSGANLTEANLSRTDLTGANLSRVICGHTAFTDCNLADCHGLESIKHKSSSSIGIDTIMASFRGAGNRLTPDLETFFLGAGVPRELLDELPRILRKVEYCSCFISYGEPDKAFAEKLVNDLKAKGVSSCWIYSMDAIPGESTWREIGQRRLEAERMLVLCSAQALVRDGILKEIEEQIDEAPDKMVPISLDNLWKAKGFKVERGERDLKPFLLERNYADFSDASCYKESLERLLVGLKRKP